MRFIAVLFFVFPSVGYASVLNGVFHYAQHYSCLGLDGVPISFDTALSSMCCAGGSLKPNASPDCRASIVTNIMGPAITAANGVTLANNVIQSTQNLHGTSTDFDTQVPLTSNNGVNAGDSAASIAGSTSAESNEGSSSETSGSGAYTSSSSGKSGSGSAGGSSGSFGGVGSATGNADSKNGSNAQAAALNQNGKNSAGGYGQAGGNKKGDGDFSGFGKGLAMFGGKEGGSAGDGGQDYQLGEKGKEELAGGASAGEEDAQGSSEDPSDYFNRTNKTDDIFKIVSARYLKKKSLWTIPQKLPEDLKQKKI
jgi:hypothetical protein